MAASTCIFGQHSNICSMLAFHFSELPFEPKESASDVQKFVSSYLKTDGLFVLRMCTSHTGIIFGTELVCALWRKFFDIEVEAIKRESSGEGPGDGESEGESKLNILRLRRKKDDSDQSGSDQRKRLVNHDALGHHRAEYDLNEHGHKILNPRGTFTALQIDDVDSSPRRPSFQKHKTVDLTDEDMHKLQKSLRKRSQSPYSRSAVPSAPAHQLSGEDVPNGQTPPVAPGARRSQI